MENKLYAPFGMLIFMITSFLVNPAPQYPGVFDILILVLPSITAIIILSKLPMGIESLPWDKPLFLVILLYLLVFTISAVIGLSNNVSFYYVMRSCASYLLFIPLISIGLISSKELTLESIIYVLIFAGIVQSLYHFYLYYTVVHNQKVFSALTISLSRITLLDPRTTEPLLFCNAVIPIVYILDKNTILIKKILFFIVILIGFFAIMITLTRSMILACLIAWIFCAIHYYKYKSSSVTEPFNLINSGKKVKKTTACIFMILVLISIYMLFFHGVFQALLMRINNQNITGNTQDYTNGRLYDEWLPAIKIWINSSWLNILFGIGSGNPFYTSLNDSRTYIHNLSIYFLVYGGLFGLMWGLLFYGILFSSLLKKAKQLKCIEYLGLACLLLCLFIYAQFFAVHKLLIYNILIWSIASQAILKREV
ncbi:MAG: O-antigen ligase family protein [Legionellales bacterium]|nr:O-antigen ligase family protein [Legionellales bacterium]